jgi:hypothetical protein
MSELKSATAAWMIWLSNEIKKLFDDPTQATTEGLLSEESKRLYIAAVAEVSNKLPVLKPAMLEMQSARYALYDALQSESDARDPVRRLWSAMEGILPQLSLLETDAPRPAATEQPGNGGTAQTPLTTGQAEEGREVPRASAKKDKVNSIEKALGLLSKHPDWPDKRIAEAAGCSPANLSGNPKYRAAREAIKGIGQESRIRSKKHRGKDMDQYADAEESTDEPPLVCASKGCEDPAGMDANGKTLTYKGKPRCLGCWKELTKQTEAT